MYLAVQNFGCKAYIDSKEGACYCSNTIEGRFFYN
jgi:hypothetical protein